MEQEELNVVYVLHGARAVASVAGSVMDAGHPYVPRQKLHNQGSNSASLGYSGQWQSGQPRSETCKVRASSSSRGGGSRRHQTAANGEAMNKIDWQRGILDYGHSAAVDRERLGIFPRVDSRTTRPRVLVQ